MHIEPGLVAEGKIWMSYITAAGAGGYAAKLAADAIRERGVLSLTQRSAATTALVLCFFEILPHHPVGVSEVHLILGSTLFLVFGVAPAAIGLFGGLLLQGLFFAPDDLPQFGMNLTTLLVPLFLLMVVARRVIAPATPYVELRYRQALALSASYQAGTVAWVAFWAFYGQGFGADNISGVASFAAGYVPVVVVEPLIDLAVLAIAKAATGLKWHAAVEHRLYGTA